MSLELILLVGYGLAMIAATCFLTLWARERRDFEQYREAAEKIISELVSRHTVTVYSR